jgi:peroxiredoxin
MPLLACKAKTTQDTPPASGTPAKTELPQDEKPESFPSAPLAAGASVFDFTALAHTGQSLKLSDYLTRPVVVYFCPQDAQPACTALATSVRDVWADLHSQVDMVYGVSPEPTIVHREFAAENQLPHLLLSDSDTLLHRIFGMPVGAAAGYLISTDRTVIHAFSPPNPAAFGAEVLAVINARGLKRPDFPI